MQVARCDARRWRMAEREASLRYCQSHSITLTNALSIMHLVSRSFRIKPVEAHREEEGCCLARLVVYQKGTLRAEGNKKQAWPCWLVGRYSNREIMSASDLQEGPSGRWRKATRLDGPGGSYREYRIERMVF
jgi:hypothetical protein